MFMKKQEMVSIQYNIKFKITPNKKPQTKIEWGF